MQNFKNIPIFRIVCKKKTRNIHLNDKFPLKVAKMISLQKIFPSCKFWTFLIHDTFVT